MQKGRSKIKCTYQSSTIYEYRKKALNCECFFLSQFNYCPLTWMFHNMSLNHKINRLHERCLRVIYNDSHSSYDELLNLNNFVSVYHWNLQILATEMFRVYTGSATDILNELFPLKPRSNYSLRYLPEFNVRPIKTAYYGLNSLSYLGPRIWELLSNNLKRLESVEAFKSKIKGWILKNCPCRICKPYIYHVGFI